MTDELNPENEPIVQELNEQLEEELKKEDAGRRPEDAAAALFSIYMPEFKKRVAQLSSNQLRRVLMALVEYPLNDRKYKAQKEIERSTFAIGHNLLESKYIMIMTTHFNLDEEAKETESHEPKEGENDGETN